MATIDSGTETLFSDDSSCELVGSPSVCYGDDTEGQFEDNCSEVNRLAPPNIQPFSGVLEKVQANVSMNYISLLLSVFIVLQRMCEFGVS